MKIEIWSDIMCPFCFIGKKHFEKALENLTFNDEINIIWKSYQLDPTLEQGNKSISATEYLMSRKGISKQYVEQMLSDIESRGASVGIDFNQDISKITNTFLAHRLIHFAQSKGKANEIEERLFKAHFTLGENVGEMNTLLNISEEIGFDRIETEQVLNSDKYSDAVESDIREAQQLGIRGVPFFVIDRKYGISGAQPVSVFEETIYKAFSESKPKFEMQNTTNANICNADGCNV